MADAVVVEPASIMLIEPDQRRKFVPPRRDCRALSNSWREAEFPCLDVATDRVRVGYWTGEPATSN
jgi:hypothetical protein